MTRTLLLIRHGQIRANARGRWHGSTDSPLTGTGRRQAQRLARQLARDGRELAAIYSSPLQRCRDTAQLIAAALDRPVQLDDDLREYSIGELEDSSFAALHTQHDFFQRIRADRDFAPRGGESLNTVAQRVVAALKRIHDEPAGGEPVAVVGHGAALAVALASLLDLDPSHWTNYRFDNCSITELQLEPRPLVAAFNRIEHL